MKADIAPRLGWLATAACVAATVGCEEPAAVPEAPPVVAPRPAPEAPPAPPPMHRPVDYWAEGRVARQVDAATAPADGHIVVDLGDAWTPYIFTERGHDDEARVDNAYRETYLALAAGEFPDDHHGARAREDRYLELFGIPPTLTLLRARFHDAVERDCAASLDGAPLQAFDGFLAYRGNERAHARARRHQVLERQLGEVAREAGVGAIADLDADALGGRDARRLAEYRDLDPEYRAIVAAQARLECEGHFEGKGRYVEGAFDWATHEALADLERRHRIYGWGFLGGDTLELLRVGAAEAERRAVVRVVTERLMHAAGVLEDGSTERDGEPLRYRGLDGEPHPVPNLEAELRALAVAAFGLETPDSTLAWLDGLGDLGGAHPVALEGPRLPEYYDGNMDLQVVIDRGDVWYEFPYDEEGRERAQPVQRRPRLTVYVDYLDQRIPLARYGTTVGGWRSEVVEGDVVWRYKNSPTGPRVWERIIASPVWLPPEGTPPQSLLDRVPGGEGPERYTLDQHEVGPSYASAYGLVAAYHRKFREQADGSLAIGGDEGIRTHGSVDYMSIMRRHSHGCHRLHNHIAVRLMSFVLGHRPHRRLGQQRFAFEREVPWDGHTYLLERSLGGYVFELDEPIRVEVLEGTVKGTVEEPIEHPIPKYDEEIGAYMMPDGGAVRVTRSGELLPTEAPLLDGGVPLDGGPDAAAAVGDAPADATAASAAEGAGAG